MHTSVRFAKRDESEAGRPVTFLYELGAFCGHSLLWLLPTHLTPVSASPTPVCDFPALPGSRLWISSDTFITTPFFPFLCPSSWSLQSPGSQPWPPIRRTPPDPGLPLSPAPFPTALTCLLASFELHDPSCMTPSRLSLAPSVLSPLGEVAGCQQHAARPPQCLGGRLGLRGGRRPRGSLSDPGAPPRAPPSFCPEFPWRSPCRTFSPHASSLCNGNLTSWGKQDTLKCKRLTTKWWEREEFTSASESLIRRHAMNTVSLLGQESTWGLPSELLSPCQTGQQAPQTGSAFLSSSESLFKGHSRLCTSKHLL